MEFENVKTVLIAVAGSEQNDSVTRLSIFVRVKCRMGIDIVSFVNMC